ncbi:hypothetical protein AAC387_Pa02g4874 [Persea americana]
MIGGKAANAGFRPLRGEEKWQCSFTAVIISAKAANAAFPPLGEEEKWQCSFTAVLSSDKEAKMRVFLRSWRRKSRRCSSTFYNGYLLIVNQQMSVGLSEEKLQMVPSPYLSWLK